MLMKVVNLFDVQEPDKGLIIGISSTVLLVVLWSVVVLMILRGSLCSPTG